MLCLDQNFLESVVSPWLKIKGTVFGIHLPFNLKLSFFFLVLRVLLISAGLYTCHLLFTFTFINWFGICISKLLILPLDKKTVKHFYLLHVLMHRLVIALVQYTSGSCGFPWKIKPSLQLNMSVPKSDVKSRKAKMCGGKTRSTEYTRWPTCGNFLRVLRKKVTEFPWSSAKTQHCN